MKNFGRFTLNLSIIILAVAFICQNAYFFVYRKGKADGASQIAKSWDSKAEAFRILKEEGRL